MVYRWSASPDNDRTSGSSSTADSEAQLTKDKSAAIKERTLEAIGDRTGFILSKENCSDSTLLCETLGVQYAFKTTGKWYQKVQVTTITRGDDMGEKSVVVAEWERHWFIDKIRIVKSASSDFQPTSDVLPCIRKFPFVFPLKMVFQANGRQYVWHSSPFSTKLYIEDDKSRAEVASYHRRKGVCKKRNAYIALSKGYDNYVLDDIIVTWALTLRRAHRNALIAHLIKFLLFDFLLTFLIDFYSSRNRSK